MHQNTFEKRKKQQSKYYDKWIEWKSIEMTSIQSKSANSNRIPSKVELELEVELLLVQSKTCQSKSVDFKGNKRNQIQKS